MLGLIPPLGIANTAQSSLNYLEHTSMERLRRFQSDFDKYDWLMRLYDTNRKLFFCLLSKHTNELMPLVYTPTVGLACQNLAMVYNDGR